MGQVTPFGLYPKGTGEPWKVCEQGKFVNKIQFTVYEAHSDCEWKRDRREVGRTGGKEKGGLGPLFQGGGDKA